MGESELKLERRRLEALERSERERLRLLRERPGVREYRDLGGESRSE